MQSVGQGGGRRLALGGFLRSAVFAGAAAASIAPPTHASGYHKRLEFSAENPAGWRNSVWYKLYGEHPNVPDSLRREVAAGKLPDTPFVNYLRWRQSLDAARFDHYHPRVAMLLAEQSLTPPASSVPATAPPQSQTSTPGAPGSPPVIPPEGQTIVPEPGTFSIACLLAATGFLARLYRKRSERWADPIA